MMNQHSPLTGCWESADTTVAEIERQLQRIMRELSQAGDAHDGQRWQALPRATCLNLLIHADEEAEAERAAQAMAALAERHPSRTLLLVAEPDAAADGLGAAITTQCTILPAVGGHLCFEEVRLTARGGTALHLASVVEPLLVADLPVIMWWLGRPPARGEPLLALVDRLVVDSAQFPDAPAGLAALDAYLTGGERTLALGDLGWRRESPWRITLADLFDPPDARPYLRQIRQVTVEYAATAAGVVGAAPLLLVGWLAARLGWQAAAASTSGGVFATTFLADEEGSASVTVRLRPRQAAGAEPGELLAVSLAAGSADAPATFTVRREKGRAALEARATLPDGREHARTVGLLQPHLPELLARELELAAADPLYTESLAVLARLVR